MTPRENHTPLTAFRIPAGLKAAAAEKARAEGRTLTAVVVDLLTRYVKRR